MHHCAHAGELGEDLRRVFVCLAAVDYGGLVEEARELQVPTEPVALGLVGAVLPEVVEPRLTDGDALRERAQGGDLFSLGLV